MTLTELNAYFSNKRKENVPTLGYETVPVSSVEFPRPWANPRILSETTAYQIVRNSKLPVELKADHGPVSLFYANSNEKYLCMASQNKVNIYSYSSQPKINQLTAFDAVQFFYLLTGHRAIGISTKGWICYWTDKGLDQSMRHKIPMLAISERITSVARLGASQLVLGSSTGELYMLSIDDDQILVSTIYSYKSFLSFITGFIRSQLPCKSQYKKPHDTQPILNLHVMANCIYSVDKNCITLCQLISEGQIEITARINIESMISSSIAQHIPPDVLKTDVQSEILNSCLTKEKEIIVLASYTIPGLGDYVQYALIAFVIDPKNATVYEKFTTSIPYSAIPDNMKSTPRIAATVALAFITFDNTVIAVSLDTVSVFEDAVVLKEDYVLYTEVYSQKDIDTAIIYTMDSGILEFKIDVAKIQAPSESGNLYCASVNDPRQRVTDIFKAKFEEAVVYGALEHSPLVFPLRPDSNDIAQAVIQMSTEILKNQSRVLPPRHLTDLYIESRYFFLNRLMLFVKENNFIEKISLHERENLMLKLEMYNISSVLWDFHKERLGEVSTQSYWKSILSDLISMEKSDMKDLSVDNVFQTKEFIEKVCDRVQLQGGDLSSQMQVFKSTNELLQRMFKTAKKFEETCAFVHEVDISTFVHPLAYHLGHRLFRLFKSNIKFVAKVNEDPEGIMTDSLDKIQEDIIILACLSLTFALEEKNTSQLDAEEEADKKYKKVRKDVIEGLCKLGLYQIAINLAQDHSDIPALLVALQTSNLHDVREKNIQYIDQFGKEYYECLLKYLDENRRTTNANDGYILELLTRYPSHAQHFLEKNELNIAWIYHHRQKDYKRSLNSLKICIAKEENERRLNMYRSWEEILTVALQQ
ncbi:uncharacterized protein EV154DRAFT_509714 [Mucor mucedo]|uniref:uncharacterized protein n=1 Tax=Mucor mucedo TaxID=29922 RepID=UPI00221FA488|nr:uncharacterized protein EV154DRAFT_509714 [Mucor mucedo]KAI7891006.1 hypothetical protein EV154DRAFT_509714 [Mucor mucedo]